MPLFDRLRKIFDAAPRDLAELNAWLERRGRPRPQTYSGDSGDRPPGSRHDSHWYRIAPDGSVWSERWLYGERAETVRAYDSEEQAFADLRPKYYPGTRSR